MTRIVVDPITRIEGHLRIEVEVQNGVVSDAWSSGTMFRGLELILQGRDPRDAWVFAQRACGVCTTVHALASVRSVENALEIKIPKNARIVRNLIAGSQYVQDHVIHFYHLHALDWVNIVSALSADPAGTAALAQSISDWPLSSASYFKGVQDKLAAFVKTGQLGPFANGYWDNAAYKLPAEANLMAAAHYLEALDWQRRIIRIHGLLGAKNPHPQTYAVGGMALSIDPNSTTALNARGLSEISQLITEANDFVDRVYIPDVLAVAGFYKDWAALGRGIGNYMSYGEFPQDDSGQPSAFYLPRGRIMGRDLSKVEPVDHTQVAETVAHSYYTYDGGDTQYKHPWDGQTKPNYTGPKPPFETLEGSDKYSWLKSPRYADQPMEVGPLARMLVAYGAGQPEVKAAVDAVLGKLGVGAEALFSTLGRIAARAIETQLIGHRAPALADRAGREPRHGRPDDRRHDPLGAQHLAGRSRRLGLRGGAPRIARPLGEDQGPEDRELPARRAEHLERLAARRQGPAGGVGGGAHRHSGRQPGTAGGDPPDDPLVRPVHGLRRPRLRP